MPTDYIGALDQGTTSTRFIVFARERPEPGAAAGSGGHGAASLRIAGQAGKEHAQIMPAAGLVEHDPNEIWRNTEQVIEEALQAAGVPGSALAAVGITNQRETTVVWSKATGTPLHNALVWMDTRTAETCDHVVATRLGGDKDALRPRTGLPVVPYFSASKLSWLLANVPAVASAAAAGDLMFGTIDSWLVYKLSGGTTHLTDVTNASRTLLMSLESLSWDPELLDVFGIPTAVNMPDIRSSSEVYCKAASPACLSGVPVCGVLGDQQAALVGQACFAKGQAKNTYGTGCFLLMNTGPSKPVFSDNQLLTTVAYQLGPKAPVTYALEGSVAIAGALVQWLRDNLGLIAAAPEVEKLAASVADNGGMYLVPAFSGLYAPYWRDDARGVMVGLTRFVNKGHIARASLEATAFQSRDVFHAMEADAKHPLKELRVDGGMVVNKLLMQFQADILGTRVLCPRITETTALGAAFAAGLAVGVWRSTDEVTSEWAQQAAWTPSMPIERRDELLQGWNKAVERSFGWVGGTSSPSQGDSNGKKSRAG